MNEHELEDRLHHERIILPEGFDGRQEAVLFRAMEQKRRPVQRAFVLAVALALLICATALAADGLGLASSGAMLRRMLSRSWKGAFLSRADSSMMRRLRFGKRFSMGIHCRLLWRCKRWKGSAR